MSEERILDLNAIHIFGSDQDHILQTVDDMQKARWGDVGQITCPEPTTWQEAVRVSGANAALRLQVSFEHRGTTKLHLTNCLSILRHWHGRLNICHSHLNTLEGFS